MKTLIKIYISVFFLCNWLPGISQTQISGIINRYAAVISLNGSDNVTVDDATGFSPGDTVLIVQMKGATFDPLQNNTLSDIKNTGRYEFMVIQQVTSMQIKFRSNFINTYDATQALQIVRVPSYQNAKVISTLTCAPWDSTQNKSKGGILAMIVSDTLELGADIDVTGKGFLGGDKTYSGNTTCYLYSTQLNYRKYATDSAGLKGEGIVQVGYAYTRGRGDLGNAGGGGNGFGSGGGGGSGYANGGTGGQSGCSDPNPLNLDLGGYGGQAPKDYFAGTTINQRDRIFVGGGGGAGRGQLAADVTKGASGGGIVFIITYNLTTNNHYIRANGGSVTVDATNKAGAGGGGGGGSIMLSADNVIGSLNLESKGGKGGNTGYCSGQGGGGGGGFVWFTGQTLPSGILTLIGGLPGISSVTPCTGSKPGFSGGDGDSANNLNPVLNGFLFNLIGTAQTICSGDVPKKLTGTKPRGGNGIYTYQWQNLNKSTSYKWININGANDIDYQPSAIPDTTDFRRIVGTTQFRPDGSSFPVTDTSKWIKIKVRPQIKGISIAPADTAICFNQPAIVLRGASSSGGDTSYPLIYSWEESLDNALWNTAVTAPNNEKDYAGTSNQTSKYYRRKVVNNICTVISNTSFIKVYPLISGNNIQPDTVICNGSAPNPMRSITTITGGASSYRFQWLKNSIDSLHWTPVSATDTFQNYNPGALNSTIFYRRVVFSGLRNTCKDTSYRVKITVLPSISNNVIHQNQTTICQNTRPNRFIGDQPTGGDNSYRYQWETSADNTAWASLQQPKPDSISYTNGIISTANPTYFRRTIYSGTYNCCKSSSASIKITVQPKIENNVIADTSEICYGQTPPGLNQKSGIVSGGDNVTYSYQWFRRPNDSIVWKDCYVTTISFQPASLFKTNYYKRKISSGTCISFSDSIKINVLPLITGNAKPGGKHEVCENTIPEAFIGPTISGGKQGVYRYFWESSISGTNWDSIAGAYDKDYTSTPLTQNTYFRRIVKSGYNNCCVSVGDTFIMNVSKHPSIPEAGDPQKLSFQFATKLHAKPVEIGWGAWTPKNEVITIVNPVDTATEVKNMPFGKNIFYWTTSNGSCPTVTDSVMVEVDDITRYNGFSPNGDDVNQYFVIGGADNSKIKKLKVFNRWGGEVYSSDNYENNWDGTAKNGQPLPDDTYYYIFEAHGNRIYKGFIVIKR